MMNVNDKSMKRRRISTFNLDHRSEQVWSLLQLLNSINHVNGGKTE